MGTNGEQIARAIRNLMLIMYGAPPPLYSHTGLIATGEAELARAIDAAFVPASTPRTRPCPTCDGGTRQDAYGGDCGTCGGDGRVPL
jgi:hypothetical protein